MKPGKALRDPWVWGQMLLMLAVGALPWLAGRVPPDGVAGHLLRPAAPGWRLAAVVALIPGLGMLIWGALSLGPNLTPATEPRTKGTMVERGAYRVVRHPIYLGLSLTLWGLAWGLTTPTMGLIAGIVSFGYFDRKAAVEERWMLARFPAYAAYRTRVRKLIPGLR